MVQKTNFCFLHFFIEIYKDRVYNITILTKERYVKMKFSLKKFIALALCVLMLAGMSATAQTNEAAVSEGKAVEATVTSGAEEVITSGAEEAITSDAEEVITSDADEVITSDADESIASDAEDVAASDADEIITSDAQDTTEDMALNFSDLASDDWAYDSILNLVKKGIVSGDTIGTIRPDGNVTREEVAKMMVVARKFKVSEDAAIEAADSSSVSDWAKGYFKTAMDKGIINGYTDGTVRGAGEVNRAEMATIIVRSINANIDGFNSTSFTDITENDWYAKYVECAKTLGVVKGYQDGSFAGENLVTRREAFAMIERMVRLLEALEA